MNEGTETAFKITSSMVKPITSAVGDNIGTLIPVGIGIMAIMIGVSLIPRVVYKFL